MLWSLCGIWGCKTGPNSGRSPAPEPVKVPDPSVGFRDDVYSDADYAGDLDSARSTSGYAAFVGTSLVSWASRRQPVAAKSTTEAEYIAANEAGSEGVWFRSFLEELGYPQTSATALYIDNQSTIKVGKNPEHHS